MFRCELVVRTLIGVDQEQMNEESSRPAGDFPLLEINALRSFSALSG